MADWYINLSYEEYKEIERQCRAFQETEHGKGTDYYHKSFRLAVAGVVYEFHGPNVKARQVEELSSRQQAVLRTPPPPPTPPPEESPSVPL